MTTYSGTPPIFYSFRRCPYAMRARLALAVAKLRVELREVKLSAKPSELLAISAKGTVPVVLLPNGTILEQSLDIMQFALAQRDPENWLNRHDTELIAENDGRFKHDLDRYKYPERHSSDAAVHRHSACRFLEKLESRLEAAAFLSGASSGFTDAAIAPFIRQFAAVDREWFAAQTFPRLQQWLANFEASELFSSIMMRVKPWVPDTAICIVDWAQTSDSPLN